MKHVSALVDTRASARSIGGARARVAIATTVIASIVGCGDDASTPVDAPAASGDGANDAAIDSPGGLSSSCEGACQTTALAAKFGSTMRVLDRAYYGITKTATGSTLHVEAYRNAAAHCPLQNDPPPDYTLILGTVPIPTSSAESTSPGNLLDFKGDLLGGDLGRRANTVALTPVAANVCESCVGMPAPSDPDGMIALDTSLVFDGGTVTGHLYATHCDSLDEQQ